MKKVAPLNKKIRKNDSLDGVDVGAILRGIVIVAVLVNHYVDHYVTVYGGGIANVMVTVFFVLSGYGISASLFRRMESHFSLKSLLLFYRVRLTKILPLLGVALCLQSLVTGSTYPLSSFFGYKLDGHYWFISSILECYLLSPLIKYLLDLNKHLMMFLLTLLLLALNSLVGQFPHFGEVLTSFRLVESPYLEIPFLNAYLFSCGMYIHSLLRKRNCQRNFHESPVARTKEEFKGSRSVLLFGLFSAALIYTIFEKLVYTSLPIFGSLLLFVIACAYGLRVRIVEKSFLTKVFTYIGVHSLPVYLFHMSYYFLFARLGVFKIDSLDSLLAWIVLLPAFIFTVLALEKVLKVVSHRMKVL